jgi:hypothetical protein
MNKSCDDIRELEEIYRGKAKREYINREGKKEKNIENRSYKNQGRRGIRDSSRTYIVEAISGRIVRRD